MQLVCKAMAEPGEPFPAFAWVRFGGGQALSESGLLQPPAAGLLVEGPGQLASRSDQVLPMLTQPLSRVGEMRRDPVEPLLAVGQIAIHLTSELPKLIFDLSAQLGLLGSDQFGGCGRGRGAQIGCEIGDCEVGFVADPGNHRHCRGAYRPGDAFLVE